MALVGHVKHEMAGKSSILSIFRGAELVCQRAHWANDVRQFFSEQDSRKLGWILEAQVHVIGLTAV